MRSLAYSVFAALLLIGVPAYPADDGTSGNADPRRLVELLKSPDGSVAAQARYALVKMGRDAVPALIEAVEKRDNLLEVIYVLNSIKDPRSATALAGLLALSPGEPLDKARSALFGLGDAAVPQLIEAMKDHVRCVNAAGVLAMHAKPGRADALYELLENKDQSVREAAVSVLRAWRDMGAAGKVGGLLTDPAPGVRVEAAAYFLAMLPDVEPPGVEGMLKDEEPAVRRNGLRIVAKGRRGGLDAGIAAMLLGDPDPEARILAVEAAYRCRVTDAGNLFVRATEDPDVEVAAQAALYAGETGAPGAVQALCALLIRNGKVSERVVLNVALGLAEAGGDYDPQIFLPYIDWENLYHVKAILPIWEERAVPSDEGIRKALRAYLSMPVDNRYKDRVKTLLERLGG